MKIYNISGKDYKLPNDLNEFQQEMYIHLVSWKWKYITTEVGYDGSIEYDAILPDSFANKYPILYPDILTTFKDHLLKFPFRIHKYFNHMASSQVANINLFLPVLIDTSADNILMQLKSDFKSLAKTELDNGFRIEFWDEPYGNLNDKSNVSGTDTDIAIAYYDKDDGLCLWLIEHKLTEKEFTECGGYRSKGKKPEHDCSKNFLDILSNKNLCYYHNVNKYEYWNITDSNKSFFLNNNIFSECPFQKGLNQLWRNQLLALSIENDPRQPYKHVFFSVVRHPENRHLDKSIKEYKELIGNNSKFSTFTSADVIKAAHTLHNLVIDNWIKWYKELYKL